MASKKSVGTLPKISPAKVGAKGAAATAANSKPVIEKTQKSSAGANNIKLPQASPPGKTTPFKPQKSSTSIGAKTGSSAGVGAKAASSTGAGAKTAAPPSGDKPSASPRDSPVVTRKVSELLLALTEEELSIFTFEITASIAAHVMDELVPPVVHEEIEIEKVAKVTRENGKAKLLYEMYDEEFDIKDGKITSEYIDEEYCLSYVMPNCKINVSCLDAKDRFAREEAGDIGVCLVEEPKGIFNGLEAGNSYYVFIVQEEEQLKRDQELMRLRALSMEGAVDPNAPEPLLKDDGRVMESCSCIYGNPCIDEYGCKDWGSRMKVALENGWKGF